MRLFITMSDQRLRGGVGKCVCVYVYLYVCVSIGGSETEGRRGRREKDL